MDNQQPNLQEREFNTMKDIRNAPYYRNKIASPFIKEDEYFEEYPLNTNFMISNYGRVYNKKGFMLMQYITTSGYLGCHINNSHAMVHRLVAITFLPVENYQLLDVNHKDGNKLNNFVENLEWCTRSQNCLHSFSIGLSKQGEQHPNSKYTEDQVIAICKLLEVGYKPMTICKKLGLPYSKKFVKFIYKLKHGILWKSVSKDFFL